MADGWLLAGSVFVPLRRRARTARQEMVLRMLPSPITGVSLTEGALEASETLRVTVASDELVAFGDGMEDDRLTASWGQEITVHLGERPLRLVV